ncbi:G patch domain and KOW motifs-containing protein homolog 1 [Myzus persicae]|uniref:G patch domain and KOW motifs-containing protein homolog 1 n=1 Tax=Myzus persicae TaxID=13164 RepID=UPI000B938CAD|nr:G patch domain and KOW motifs-containing protein homolog 1 [Myzus persicae]
MEEDTIKISFSFKQISKPKVIPVLPKTENAVQFIECVEEKAIKVAGMVEKVDHELVIPMPKSVKQRLPTKEVVSSIPNKPQENGASTLEEMAVQAILKSCKKREEGEEEEEDDAKIVEVPLIIDPQEGMEMSTAEDYENIPIDKFGVAMLRGMGWKPNKGVGKNSQIVAANLPEIRSKGMGLGADKLIKSVQKTQSSEEELKLKQGSFVQFIMGKLNGQYGQVCGFDELSSRVIVKVSRTGELENVSENLFNLVTKSDYDKNCNVINIKQYKEYHEGKTKTNDSVDQSNHREKITKEDIYSDNRSRHHKTKKSKHSKSPHRKHKSNHNKHKKYKHKKSSS